MRTVIAFLLLASCAFAEPPTPTIDGPREVHSGALVTLDASGSAGAEAFGWMVDTALVKVPGTSAPDVTRQVSELEALGFEVTAPHADDVPLYEVEDGGKRLRLSSYPGVYRVTLGVSNADGVAMLEWTVKVDGAKPGPGPKPDDPDPPIPVPTATLEKIAYDGVKAKATDANRLEFVMVAGVYLSAAEDAKNGRFSKTEDLLANVKSLTYSVMPVSIEAWKPTAQALEVQLDKMRDSGTLDTTKPAAYAGPFREIGNGITKALGLTELTEE